MAVLAALSSIARAGDDGVAIPQTSSDRALAPWQDRLLDLAFATASALPLNPHVKDRAQAQEEVVDACLALDQPTRARAFLQQIPNWRRGAAWADLGFWIAQHGGGPAVPDGANVPDVKDCLDRALALAERPIDENPQDWQRDRIRVKVARTHALLGDLEQAARLEAGVEPSERGKVAIVAAAKLDPDAGALQAQLDVVDKLVTAGEFDPLRHALEACVRLHERFYADAARRAAIEQKLRDSWTRLPVVIRIDLTLQLADSALAHEDRDAALKLAKEAQELVDAATWRPGAELSARARVAVLRHRAGAVVAARRDLEQALTAYDAQRAQIVDIDRAETLRSIAEAFQETGDPPTALTLCRRVVEEGMGNPNSRPRAEDLVSTLCSMALHGMQPDAALEARMNAIHAGLGRPW